jgi:hypothetical protein
MGVVRGAKINSSFRQLSMAIRSHCLECVSHVRNEVILCTGYKCKLYPYRLGVKEFNKARRNSLGNLKNQQVKV